MEYWYQRYSVEEVKGAIRRLNSLANSYHIGLVIALLTAVIGLCLGSCLRKLGK